jgi:YtkA-like
MRSVKQLVVLLGPCLALLSCGGGGGSQSTPTDAGADVIDCSTDPRVALYKPNLTVTSASGALKFQLVASNPGPPARGTDTWNLMVTSAAGVAQPNLSLSVLPFMPDHGHGTSVDASVAATGGGNYTVAPLYFFMPGVWRTTFTSAASGSTAADTAEFFFCIPG